MATPRRTNRLASQIRSFLAEAFLYEVSEPVLERFSVTEVKVMPDLREARIFYEAPDDAEHSDKKMEEALGRVQWQLRKRLAGELQLRHAMELRFVRDRHAAKVARVYQLFDEIAASRTATAADDETSDPEKK